MRLERILPMKDVLWVMSFLAMRNGSQHGLKPKEDVSWSFAIMTWDYSCISLVAQKRYDEIAVDSQAFEPYAEEEKRPNDTVKSTKSSAKLIHLVESVTGMYSHVGHDYVCSSRH